MTVSAKVRKSLPASRLGEPETGGYPMQDKKHAAIAKGFAAMHHAPNKAAIDAKANAILAKKRGGLVIGGKGKKPSLGRAGRAGGGKVVPQSSMPSTPQLNPLQQQLGSSPDPASQFTPPTKHFPTLGPMFRTGGAMYT